MDDVLYEILMKLPPRLVSRFKDVSPRWSQLINTNFFRQNYAKRWQGELKLLGFFVLNTDLMRYQGKSVHGSFRQLSSYWWPSTSITTDDLKEPEDFLKSRGKGFFITTCNGLVLSGLPPMYYVCNPLSKQSYQLPKSPSHFEYDSVAFWCKDSDTNLSINFKVVFVRITYAMYRDRTSYRSVPIETFCSRTRKWSKSTLKCSSKFRIYPYHVAATVTRNGVIYWKAMQQKLAIHDLNQEETHVTLIEDPQSPGNYLNSFGESSDGRLQYGECDLVGIKILVLDKLQWNLRYNIPFSLILSNNPTIKGCKELKCLSWIPQNSESIFMRAGRDKFFVYHFSTGKIERVPYLRGHSRKLDSQWFLQDASEYYHIEPYYERLWHDLSFFDKNPA